MMQEAEIDNADQVAFFLANEVINEYHAFPMVQRADIGGPNKLFILLNSNWYQLSISMVADLETITRLEDLVQ